MSRDVTPFRAAATAFVPGASAAASEKAPVADGEELSTLRQQVEEMQRKLDKLVK